MTEKLDCGAARRRLPDMVDGPVDAALSDHFAGCGPCAGELRLFRALLEATSDLSGGIVPEPGESYWREFLPSVRARIARETARRAARSRLPLSAAAAVLLMLASAAGALFFAPGGSPLLLKGRAEAVSIDEAGRRVDEAFARRPDLAGELASEAIGIEMPPAIAAGDALEALKELERPPSLYGSWTDLEDDELQRLLDRLDRSQVRRLRAELAADNG